MTGSNSESCVFIGVDIWLRTRVFSLSVDRFLNVTGGHAQMIAANSSTPLCQSRSMKFELGDFPVNAT